MRLSNTAKTFLKVSTAILFLLAFMVPQSFAYIKVPFLGFSLVAIIIGMIRNEWKINNPLFFPYYAVFGSMTIIFSFIGLLRGNPEEAIFDSIRLYFVFMWIYFILALYISNTNYQKHIDQIFCISAIGISATAFYTLLNSLYSLNWISDDVASEMLLEVGIREGYIQMNNVNVGMFTFIIPYLLSRIIIDRINAGYTLIFCLVLSVVAAILASRRIVIIVFFLAPILTYVISRVIGIRKHEVLKRAFLFYLSVCLGITLLSLYFYNYFPAAYEGFVHRLADVFTKDETSPRQEQHVALLQGFFNYPLFGSGFGGLVDSIRSEERPWTFELTYSRILFNSGIIGFSLLSAFYIYYVVATLGKIKRSDHKTIYVPLLVGFFCVLIASASNPYLSSFDFIFVLSIIPLILNTRDVSYVNSAQ